MEITKIEIKDFTTGKLCSGNCEGLCHRKALPYLSLVQAVEGNYTIRLDRGEEKDTGEGGIFIAPSQVTQTITHHVNPESGIMKARWIFMNIHINGLYRAEHLYQFPVTVPDSRESQWKERMDALFRAKDPCDRMSLCYQLVKALLALGTPRNTAECSKLSPVISYLENNYQKPVTVAELAKLTSMSESNFHAVFKKVFGKSPISYLNDYRLSVASDLLLRTDTPVAAVSEAAGFSDPFYFSRLFKIKYGTSPREYRKKSAISNKS